MELKEKFEATMISFLINKNQDKTMLEHFEKITDDYAIEFSDWICKYYETDGIFLGILNTKNLLEIYKKEKENENRL
jgi:hypothetical protein